MSTPNGFKRAHNPNDAGGTFTETVKFLKDPAVPVFFAKPDSKAKTQEIVFRVIPSPDCPIPIDPSFVKPGPTESPEKTLNIFGDWVSIDWTVMRMGLNALYRIVPGGYAWSKKNSKYQRFYSFGCAFKELYGVSFKVEAAYAAYEAGYAVDIDPKILRRCKPVEGTELTVRKKAGELVPDAPTPVMFMQVLMYQYNDMVIPAEGIYGILCLSATVRNNFIDDITKKRPNKKRCVEETDLGDFYSLDNGHLLRVDKFRDAENKISYALKPVETEPDADGNCSTYPVPLDAEWAAATFRPWDEILKRDHTVEEDMADLAESLTPELAGYALRKFKYRTPELEAAGQTITDEFGGDVLRALEEGNYFPPPTAQFQKDGENERPQQNARTQQPARQAAAPAHRKPVATGGFKPAGRTPAAYEPPPEVYMDGEGTEPESAANDEPPPPAAPYRAAPAPAARRPAAPAAPAATAAHWDDTEGEEPEPPAAPYRAAAAPAPATRAPAPAARPAAPSAPAARPATPAAPAAPPRAAAPAARPAAPAAPSAPPRAAAPAPAVRTQRSPPPAPASDAGWEGAEERGADDPIPF